MPEQNDTAVPPGRSSKRRGRFAASAVVLFVGAAAVLYGMDLGGKGAAQAACPGREPVLARLDPLIRGEVAAFGLRTPVRAAPDLSFKGPDDRPTSLAALKGKTLLVNLWATWCVPCRKEMPALDKLQGKLGGENFQVVAINVDTARLDRPRAFLHDAGIEHLSFYADPSANVLQELKTGGQLLGLPTTLLIDREGCELGTMAGPADWASPDAERLLTAAKG